MASGDFIACWTTTICSHPRPWPSPQAIVSQGADLIYSDEMNFAGDISQVSLIHFKPVLPGQSPQQ
jgi:isopentenyldiphosphate isomerase